MAHCVLRLNMSQSAACVLGPETRAHTRRSKFTRFAASTREFGFTNPVLIDADKTIVAGHGRVEAGKVLGLARVPTICPDHLTPQQKRAYVIADNRLAEKAGWGPEILKIEFQHLSLEELEFELEITGFDTAEIDIILDGSSKPPAAGPADAVPEMGRVAVTRRGDLCLVVAERITAIMQSHRACR